MTRDRRWVSAALAVLAGAQLVLVGWSVTARAPVVYLLGQALLLALLGLGLAVSRYLRFRRVFEQTLARSAVEHERAMLAEELHDALGHELSLVALRAGALQVTSSGDVSERAAELRLQVEHAVLQLRQTVELLRSPGPDGTVARPVGDDVAALVERARAAGALVELDDALGDAVAAPVRLTAFRVAQEGLTNAVKHSPGSVVRIRRRQDDGAVHVTVETDGDAEEEPASWSGLASLRRRVESLGGDLWTTARNGRRTLHARIPLDVSPPPAPVPAAAVPFRRPAVSTLRWAIPPLVSVAVVATVFYAWSTHGATLEQDRFDGLAPGLSAADARSVLPAAQARVRLTPVAPAPAGSTCAYYTDGNFPLGMAAFEVCDDGRVVTRVSDLRRVPLR